MPGRWLPIATIVGTAITLQEPCWSKVKTGEYPGYGNPTRLENAYELIESAGEWYLDRNSHTHFYQPHAWENLATATVEVPVSEQLIAISGDAVNPVSGLAFVGLAFRLANWLQPSTGLGLAGSQANQDSADTTYDWVVKAAVDCTGARNTSVTACAFSQLGGGVCRW